MNHPCRALLASTMIVAVTAACGNADDSATETADTTSTGHGRTSLVPADPNGSVPDRSDYPGVVLETTLPAQDPAAEPPATPAVPSTTSEPLSPPPPLFEVLAFFEPLSCTVDDSTSLAQQIVGELADHDPTVPIEVHGWVDDRGDPSTMFELARCRGAFVAQTIEAELPALEVSVVPHGIDDLRFPDCAGDCTRNRSVSVEAAE